MEVEITVFIHDLSQINLSKYFPLEKHEMFSYKLGKDLLRTLEFVN